jgi:hypothetical protein
MTHRVCSPCRKPRQGGDRPGRRATVPISFMPRPPAGGQCRRPACVSWASGNPVTPKGPVAPCLSSHAGVREHGRESEQVQALGQTRLAFQATSDRKRLEANANGIRSSTWRRSAKPLHHNSTAIAEEPATAGLSTINVIGAAHTRTQRSAPVPTRRRALCRARRDAAVDGRLPRRPVVGCDTPEPQGGPPLAERNSVVCALPVHPPSKDEAGQVVPYSVSQPRNAIWSPIKSLSISALNRSPC